MFRNIIHSSDSEISDSSSSSDSLDEYIDIHPNLDETTEKDLYHRNKKKIKLNPSQLNKKTNPSLKLLFIDQNYRSERDKIVYSSKTNKFYLKSGRASSLIISYDLNQPQIKPQICAKLKYKIFDIMITWDHSKIVMQAYKNTLLFFDLETNSLTEKIYHQILCMNRKFYLSSLDGKKVFMNSPMDIFRHYDTQTKIGLGLYKNFTNKQDVVILRNSKKRQVFGTQRKELVSAGSLDTEFPIKFRFLSSSRYFESFVCHALTNDQNYLFSSKSNKNLYINNNKSFKICKIHRFSLIFRINFLKSFEKYMFCVILGKNKNVNYIFIMRENFPFSTIYSTKFLFLHLKKIFISPRVILLCDEKEDRLYFFENPLKFKLNVLLK